MLCTIGGMKDVERVKVLVREVEGLPKDQPGDRPEWRSFFLLLSSFDGTDSPSVTQVPGRKSPHPTSSPSATKPSKSTPPTLPLPPLRSSLSLPPSPPLAQTLQPSTASPLPPRRFPFARPSRTMSTRTTTLPFLLTSRLLLSRSPTPATHRDGSLLRPLLLPLSPPHQARTVPPSSPPLPTPNNNNSNNPLPPALPPAVNPRNSNSKQTNRAPSRSLSHPQTSSVAASPSPARSRKRASCIGGT